MDQQIATINIAINAIKVLRTSVSNVFEFPFTAQAVNPKDESSYLIELQDVLNTVNTNLKEVENSICSLATPNGPFNLGNTAFLNYETNLERQQSYPLLVNSYKWLEKIHHYSTMASQMLSQNTLKRSYYTSSNKRRRPLSSSHNVPPMLVDQIINSINNNNMTLKIYRPFAKNAFLHLSLSRVLKAAIVLRGLMIEWVTVKGFNESLDNVDDHWNESRYHVFRKVQDHAHSAMLHFFSPTFAELAIRSFITWFGSYSTLFSEPCKKCGNHLLNALPPTYRDLRSLEPFHEECRH
ncbi:unnamed protein product [Diamesa hyperborea]